MTDAKADCMPACKDDFAFGNLPETARRAYGPDCSLQGRIARVRKHAAIRTFNYLYIVLTDAKADCMLACKDDFAFGNLLYYLMRLCKQRMAAQLVYYVTYILAALIYNDIGIALI